jgi:hypothetical protein
MKPAESKKPTEVGLLACGEVQGLTALWVGGRLKMRIKQSGNILT